MSNRSGHLYALLLLTTLISVAGCSSEGDSAGGLGGAFSGKTGDPVNCDQTLTQAKIDQFNASQAIPNLAGVRGYGYAHCSSQNTVNGQGTSQDVEGFAGLYAVPSMTLLNETRAEGSFFEILLDSQPLTPEALDQIKAAFKPLVGDIAYPAIMRIESFDNAALSDLPANDIGFGVVVRPDGKNVRTLRFNSPTSLESRYAQALRDFEAGAVSIQLELGADRAAATVSLGKFKAGDKISLNKMTRMSAIQFLSERWARISRLGSLGINHPELPYSWMSSVLDWWPSLKLTSSEGQKQFSEGLALATSQWNPRREPVGIPRSSLLKSLRFLSALNPASALDKYVHALQVIAPFYLSDVDATYAELVDLSELHPLAPDQEKVVVDAALKLKSKLFGSQAWQSAKRISQASNYETAKISLIIDAGLWIGEVQSSSDFDTASSWVTTYGLDQPGLSRLKSFFKFLDSKITTSDAFARAVNLVVKNRGTDEQVAIFQATFSWLDSKISTSEALTKTDRYITELKMTAEQFRVLKLTFDWLDHSLASSTALTKAEHFVLDAKLSADDVSRLQAVFAWLDSHISTSEALIKAEDYVVTRHLTKDQTDAMMSAFAWLDSKISTSEALKKSENYVVNLGLSTGAVDQLKALFGFYDSILSSTEALKHTEDMVLTNKLTRAQTDLLQAAYKFVYQILSGTESLARAESYLVKSKMTQTQFDALMAAYRENYRTLSGSAALAKAEKDVLGR